MNLKTPCRIALYLLCILLYFVHITPCALAKLARDPANISQTPKRIVSLAPSITEILFALGASPFVVGRTMYSDYPPEALKLPSIGSYFRPELERIVALQPDLCIVTKDGNPKAVIERLTKLGIPLVYYDATTMEALFETIKRLGKITNTEKRADQLIFEAKSRLVSYAQRVKARTFKPRVLIPLQINPVLAASTHTYIGRLVGLAGAENVVTSTTLYPRLSSEDILQLAPDIVILSTMEPGQLAEKQGILKDLPHFRISPDLFNRPSLRSLDAIGLLLDYFDTLNPHDMAQ